MKAYLFNLDMFKNDYDYAADRVVFEIAKADIMDVIQYQGKFYRVCMQSSRNDVIGVEPTEFNSVGDEYNLQSSIVCPFCGHVDSDSWEVRDDEGEMDCGACGSTFLYRRNVEVTYDTMPVKSTSVRVLS